MSKVFISYKRLDKTKVFELKKKIDTALNLDCWIDVDGIESDQQFINVIISAINRCEVVLFMYSKQHTLITDYENDWTIRELSFALQKKKRIIFINIDNSTLTDWFIMMFGIRQHINSHSQKDLSNLIRDLKKWLHIDGSDEYERNNKGGVSTDDEKDEYYGYIIKRNDYSSPCRINNIIGRGKTGIVYSGEKLKNPPQKIAIKRFILSNFGRTTYITGEPILLQSVWNKVRSALLCSLDFSHPSLVKTFNVINQRGDLFSIMEYLHGTNLNHYVAFNPLSEIKAVNILKRIALGAAYLHKKGFIHCDINPRNIMWDERSNEAKLIDLSSTLNLNEGMEKSNPIFYTKVYAAPELLDRRFKWYYNLRGEKILKNWAKIDIYSLGATLYHLLTNKYPTVIQDKEYLLSDIKYNLEIIGSSQNLIEVVLKAMAVDPDNRFDNLEKFIYSLDALDNLKNVPLYKPMSLEMYTERETEQNRSENSITTVLMNETEQNRSENSITTVLMNETEQNRSENSISTVLMNI